MRFGFKEFRKSPHSESTEFRKRYPVEIRAATGKQHFTLSVGQISQKTASAAFARAFVKYEERCEELRRLGTDKSSIPIISGLPADEPPDFALPLVDPAMADEAIERWRLVEIGRAYMDIANGLIDINRLSAEAMRRSELCATLAQPQSYRRISDFDDRMLAALATQGVSIPRGHPALRMLRYSFMQAWLDVERYKDRMICDPVSVDPPRRTAEPLSAAAQVASQTSASQPVISGITLKILAEEWLSSNKKPVKTQGKLRRCVRMLTEHLGGDVPVESITPQQLDEFYQAAVKLPARPRQHELVMSFRELTEQSIPNLRRLTIQTVANWVNILHSVCNWGRRRRLISFNPITDNKPDASEAKSKYPTLIPTDGEVARLFSSSIYTDRRRSPAWFWLPLLAIYTGARLNELGQLEQADVSWDEVPFFDITTDMTEDNDEDAPARRAKTLKNNNSKRRVPIHPKLLELGFRDYWQSVKGTYLFPDLPHHNLRDNQTPTQNFSRAFGRYLRKLEITKGVKFHSFRHLFTDYSEDMGVHPKARSVLVGHAVENDLTLLLAAQMTDQYGTGYGRKSRLKFMLNEISKISYPAIPTIEPWSSISPSTGSAVRQTVSPRRVIPARA